MQTIETYYLGATPHKPARIKARASGGFTVTLPVDDWRLIERDRDDDKHKRTAQYLIEKVDWDCPGWDIAGGHTLRGMVWVLVRVCKCGGTLS